MPDRISIPTALLGYLKKATALLQESPDDVGSVDQALQHLMGALAHEDFGRADQNLRAMILSLVAAAYQLRYQQTGELRDLDNQILYQERELALVQPASPDAFDKLTALAGRLLDREDRTGTSIDLERAIRILQDVIGDAPTDAPSVAIARIDLGGALRRRYSRLGDIADLDEAIANLQDAPSSLPPGDRNVPVALALKGVALFDRYRLRGMHADLNGTIANLRRAVNLSEAGDPRLHARLTNLAVALGEEFEYSGREEDLDESIATFERALQTSPVQDLGVCLTNLSYALKHRYALSSDHAVLDMAVARATQALNYIAPGRPERLHILANAGSMLMDRFRLTADVQDLKAAISDWEQFEQEKQALSVGISFPRGLHLGLQWAWLQSQLVEAYMELLSRLRGEEAAMTSRRIVELIEANKAPLLTDIASRGQLLTPASIPAELIAREAELLHEVRRIDAAELATRGDPGRRLAEIRDMGADFVSLDVRESYVGWIGATSTMLMEPEDRINLRRKVHAELDGLWTEMSKLGTEAVEYVSLRCRGPMDCAQMSKMASDLGPKTAVLSLGITSERTLLYIFRAGQELAFVQAPLNQSRWNDVRRRLSDEMEGEALTSHQESWVGPVRSLLEQTRPYLDGVDRIVIAPDRAAHLIPWSVAAREAGVLASDGSPVSVATLPALALLPRLRSRARAVAAARGRTQEQASRRTHRRSSVGPPVVVGNPTGDLGSAEFEAREVGKALGVKPLLGEEAELQEVIPRLSDAPIIHIAAHAEFVPSSPLDSGIMLADGVLTARDAMVVDIAPDLLVLSACQTGTAHGVTGEELANMAHAFLAAGSRSMLVSLWDVDDETTAQLMTSFYRMRREGLDKAAALKSAMDSVCSDHEYSDPYYWAGFVLLGDWE
jgi:CHAT domain-containing protein